MEATEKTEKILNHIRTNLLHEIIYFEIKIDELLNDEPNNFSITISFKPKEVLVNEESKMEGRTHSLQFDMDGDQIISLIVGEDSEQPVTPGNIYKALYWSEVFKPIVVEIKLCK